MADKEKRLRKILSKFALKGKLKLVATLDEAHIVIVEDRNDKSNTKFIGKEVYIKMLENGYTFPEENIFFTVSSNPRDKKNIEQKLLPKTIGFCLKHSHGK